MVQSARIRYSPRTSQAESPVAAEPPGRQKLAVRRANEFLGEQSESTFRVGDKNVQKKPEPRRLLLQGHGRVPRGILFATTAWRFSSRHQHRQWHDNFEDTGLQTQSFPSVKCLKLSPFLNQVLTAGLESASGRRFVRTTSFQTGRNLCIRWETSGGAPRCPLLAYPAKICRCGI